MLNFLLFFLIAILCIVESVKLMCNFEVDADHGYLCKATNLQILSKSDRMITELTGDHQKDKTDDDVKFFSSDSNVVRFFPLNLSHIFKNLESVQIETSTLSDIYSSDLKQFGEKLRKLWLGSNAITALDFDLFKFTPNLEEISFYGNQIRHVDSGVFSNLNKLSKVFFTFNVCHSGSSFNGILSLVGRIEEKCKDFQLMAGRLRTQLDKVEEELNQIKQKCNLNSEVLLKNCKENCSEF